MPLNSDIKIPEKKIAGFCKKNHIKKLSFFGSILRDDFRQESDVDILVEFDSEHIPGLITLAGMEIELSKILDRKVDLRTAQDLSSYFRQAVIDGSVIQYAE